MFINFFHELRTAKIPVTFKDMWHGIPGRVFFALAAILFFAIADTVSAEEPLRREDPWVFEGSSVRHEPSGVSCPLSARGLKLRSLDVYDKDGHFVACDYWLERTPKGKVTFYISDSERLSDADGEALRFVLGVGHLFPKMASDGLLFDDVLACRVPVFVDFGHLRDINGFPANTLAWSTRFGRWKLGVRATTRHGDELFASEVAERWLCTEATYRLNSLRAGTPRFK